MKSDKTTDLFRAAYIINYFSNLLTKTEKDALRHYQTSYSVGFDIDDSSTIVKKAYEKGWLSSHPKVLDLLKDGYETFELNVANRVMNETPEKVFFNNCVKCGGLARTPFARQCRFCGNNWHHIIQAKFELNQVIQIKNRGFYLVGNVTGGDFKAGNFLDLTPFGLNARPTIKSIQFTLKRQDSVAKEYFTLEINELTAEQQEYLKPISSSALKFDILNER